MPGERQYFPGEFAMSEKNNAGYPMANPAPGLVATSACAWCRARCMCQRGHRRQRAHWLIFPQRARRHHHQCPAASDCSAGINTYNDVLPSMNFVDLSMIRWRAPHWPRTARARLQHAGRRGEPGRHQPHRQRRQHNLKPIHARPTSTRWSGYFSPAPILQPACSTWILPELTSATGVSRDLLVQRGRRPSDLQHPARPSAAEQGPGFEAGLAATASPAAGGAMANSRRWRSARRQGWWSELQAPHNAGVYFEARLPTRG